MPPLSTMQWTYGVDPEAMFVKAHAHSSYRCGSYEFFKYAIILGTKFASITNCIGGLGSKDKIFLIPIAP